jgi:regulator of protease activity HflC (stomatin/prohibitin superfamily)
MDLARNPLTILEAEHRARQIQRVKIRAPLLLVGVALVVASLGVAALLGYFKHLGAAVAVGSAGVILAILWSMSAQLVAEWDRALVLRIGQFRAIRGPGIFMLVPILDRVLRVLDTRVRTTSFFTEGMLTKDTVPVGVDAIAFWHVWDAKKAVLEVESYYQAIVLAVQTALRDIVGVHTLAEVLANRDKIAQTLQVVLKDKTEAWGMSVTSIEIRDIMIPAQLKDALSKQAQAERERQARVILGEAEKEVAEKFVEAAERYGNNPVAVQLRAMNILAEGLREGASLMLVPSSALDTMNLGGLTALGAQRLQEGSSSGGA